MYCHAELVAILQATKAQIAPQTPVALDAFWSKERAAKVLHAVGSPLNTFFWCGYTIFVLLERATQQSYKSYQVATRAAFTGLGQV